MLQFKKSELESVLLTIIQYSAPKEGEVQKMIGGLLSEQITLGTKRSLQKIHKETLKIYQELLTDFKQVNEECKEDKEKLESELKALLEETVKVDAEPIKLSFLDNVSTSNNYNFDIIEKFAI